MSTKKPILLRADRGERERKKCRFMPEEEIKKIHYFEFIDDERVNVTKSLNTEQQLEEQNNVVSPSSNVLPNSRNDVAPSSPLLSSSSSSAHSESQQKTPLWRPPKLIDFTPLLPSPGWNSVERSAQAEREQYTLGAIDLPGQTSTIDEPDQAINNNCHTRAQDDDNITIIPLENPEGVFTEYPDMYNSEPVVESIAPFNNQSYPMFQQQFITPIQNPFFRDNMSVYLYGNNN